MSELKRYFKVSMPDVSPSNHYIADLKGAIDELDSVFNYDEAGAIVNFELVEMTEEEYNKLPEFEGW